ncbi:hypothetical protein FE257_005031 [Aspergillus nanangensis]|uniref:Phosphatidylethanolamine-binding protein n=1 Tax=Aspergillus nanangensis TaxID=2582783 RepID=A0AAD4CR73_ASPNN|nr:hypothetical protein FE257_005031 [Aspergillus nanangensis]
MSQDLAFTLAQSGLLTSDLQALIPQGFSPSTELSIRFGTKPLSLGNIFRASECKEVPLVSFAKEVDDTNASRLYTLLLIDPDAPTPDDPKFTYWRHWVVKGLRPVETGGPVTISDVLTAYLGPGPKDEEPDNLSLSKEDIGGEEFVQRRSFKAVEWVEQHGLQLVGVNWMRGVGDGWQE